jgi:hypothetical protein
MSSLMKRLRIIPLPAWIVGLLAPLLILPVWLKFMASRANAELLESVWTNSMGSRANARLLELMTSIGWLLLPALFFFVSSLLVGFVYADAKRRGMRHVMWAWLAAVPYFIGVILYFILRDRLPDACPHCGKEVRQDFAFCPVCGASLHPICPQCGKSLQQGWKNCPHCGILLPTP